MPTPQQLQAIRLYADLMEEVKIRIDSLNITLWPSQIPGQIIREFGFLQLRILCELIALGCLVAHGDIEETTKLKKEYAADKIIERLEKLHPDFYPWPVKQTKISPNHHQLEIIKTGYLTKTELLQLYGKCGDVLHRGSLKKLLSPKMPIINNHQEIADWGQKIQNLLGHHGFMLFDKNTVTLCMLRNMDDNNRVQVAIAESKPPLQASA